MIRVFVNHILFNHVSWTEKDVVRIKNKSFYRLPLKLVNDFTWANLSKPSKALLPVIGCHINQHNKACYLSRTKMAEYTDYINLWQTIDKALKELVKKELLTKEKSFPCHKYLLTEKSKCEKGKSFFPFYRYQIENGYWAQLKSCEKSFYVIAAIKGTINHPDVNREEGHYCLIDIKNVKRFYKWAGISEMSFWNARISLIEKELLVDLKGRVYYLKKLGWKS